AASMALSPRQARFAPHSTVLLADAEGQVSACQIAPYPPGVPVVAPGERIEKKNLAYLSEIGYNMQEKIEIVDL
ncbi:MAG: amino acid decarboxylase, partial [Pseudoflavonifractor sp.]